MVGVGFAFVVLTRFVHPSQRHAELVDGDVAVGVVMEAKDLEVGVERIVSRSPNFHIESALFIVACSVRVYALVSTMWTFAQKRLNSARVGTSATTVFWTVSCYQYMSSRGIWMIPMVTQHKKNLKISARVYTTGCECFLE